MLYSWGVNIKSQSLPFMWCQQSSDFCRIPNSLNFFAAFTSQELRLMIPDELVIENVCYSIFEAKWSYGDFKLFYHNKEIRDIGRGAIYKFINENECTVRSDLLQKLLEDDRVSVNLINKRISKFHGKVIL